MSVHVCSCTLPSSPFALADHFQITSIYIHNSNSSRCLIQQGANEMIYNFKQISKWRVFRFQSCKKYRASELSNRLWPSPCSLFLKSNKIRKITPALIECQLYNIYMNFVEAEIAHCNFASNIQILIHFYILQSYYAYKYANIFI